MKIKDIKNTRLDVTMPDGSVWGVPVEIIAVNRAKEYAHEFGDNVERSLKEDTIPLFESDDFEIEDWAANNMNWDEVKTFAVAVKQPPADYQEGWINGEKEVIEIEA